MSISDTTREQAREIIARYPQARSALLPMLHLMQAEEGYVSADGISLCAEELGLTTAEVAAVATFYTMYNLQPVGQYLVQVCRTTPCCLRGARDITKACKDFLKCDLGETDASGTFTLVEVECLGACVNAPMVQINDDYYEDLTPESMKKLLKALKDGKKVAIGSQTGRQCSEAQKDDKA